MPDDSRAAELRKSSCKCWQKPFCVSATCLPHHSEKNGFRELLNCFNFSLFLQLWSQVPQLLHFKSNCAKAIKTSLKIPSIYYLDVKHHNIIVICLRISYVPLRNLAIFKFCRLMIQSCLACILEINDLVELSIPAFRRIENRFWSCQILKIKISNWLKSPGRLEY